MARKVSEQYFTFSLTPIFVLFVASFKVSLIEQMMEVRDSDFMRSVKLAKSICWDEYAKEHLNGKELNLDKENYLCSVN